MKKVSVDKVSITLIKAIPQSDIAKRAQKMSDAVYGDPDVFSGILPFVLAAFGLLISGFLAAEGAYAVGGSLKKNAFLTARAALYAGVLAFAPYVNKLANGNSVILGLSTLPLVSDEPDYGALIAAGGLAQKITASLGAAVRQIVANCASFGQKIGYTVIVSEGVPLPEGFTLTSDGTIVSPAGNRIFANCFGSRKKVFSNLLPKTEYFVYYVLTYGTTTIGLVSAGKSIVTSA